MALGSHGTPVKQRWALRPTKTSIAEPSGRSKASFWEPPTAGTLPKIFAPVLLGLISLQPPRRWAPSIASLAKGVHAPVSGSRTASRSITQSCQVSPSWSMKVVPKKVRPTSVTPPRTVPVWNRLAVSRVIQLVPSALSEFGPKSNLPSGNRPNDFLPVPSFESRPQRPNCFRSPNHLGKASIVVPKTVAQGSCVSFFAAFAFATRSESTGSFCIISPPASSPLAKLATVHGWANPLQSKLQVPHASKPSPRQADVLGEFSPRCPSDAKKLWKQHTNEQLRPPSKEVNQKTFSKPFGSRTSL